MKKILIFVIISVLTFCFEPTMSAQSKTTLLPFKGFNIGFTGQMELVQKIDFVPVYGTEAPPLTFHAMGWEAGVELSYHFARYFGVSIGLNVGTINAMRFSPYARSTEFEGGWNEDFYHPTSSSKIDFILPLQFEFHYPLKHNFYFTTSVGVKLKDLRTLNMPYNYSYEASLWTGDEDVTFFILDFDRNREKIEVDLLLSAGIYYRLPYADFLRLTVGANFALNKYASGYYEFYPYINTPWYSFGTFNLHNNFMYLQLAYIHTFA
ncbi:hypothetical protein LJC37_06045, partial [Bacteroidales bacterium OttesenSCG-928-E04]|nr:hypothetical protein [Bacteroidales bacterium OttesenSCG-928-E04]